MTEKPPLALGPALRTPDFAPIVLRDPLRRRRGLVPAYADRCRDVAMTVLLPVVTGPRKRGDVLIQKLLLGNHLRGERRDAGGFIGRSHGVSGGTQAGDSHFMTTMQTMLPIPSAFIFCFLQSVL